MAWLLSFVPAASDRRFFSAPRESGTGSERRYSERLSR